MSANNNLKMQFISQTHSARDAMDTPADCTVTPTIAFMPTDAMGDDTTDSS